MAVVEVVRKVFVFEHALDDFGATAVFEDSIFVVVETVRWGVRPFGDRLNAKVQFGLHFSVCLVAFQILKMRLGVLPLR